VHAFLTEYCLIGGNVAYCDNKVPLHGIPVSFHCLDRQLIPLQFNINCVLFRGQNMKGLSSVWKLNLNQFACFQISCHDLEMEAIDICLFILFLFRYDVLGLWCWAWLG